MAEWIDLIDPSPDELRSKLPRAVQESALELLVAPARHTDEPRPTLQAHGDYIFGVFLVAIAVPDEDRVFYQEIDELEDTVETAPAESTRNRLSDLRHDLLHIRRTLSPTRDAVRRVVDNVIEVDEGKEVFPHDVEIAFNSAYDKLLRAFDGLELSRDLIASVRDYLQAKVANDQNEVMKTLTVIASLLLLPTFIVGLYGQNFQHHFPEIHWQLGYLWSWALIVVTTIGQLVFFRRKKWI